MWEILATTKVKTPTGLSGVERAKARVAYRVGVPCVKADPKHLLLIMTIKEAPTFLVPLAE
jgi:hypothetical protein